MRARSALAGLPAAGTRRDRLARALSEDWASSAAIGAAVDVGTNEVSQVLLEEVPEQRAEARRVSAVFGYRYEWRRGALWESAYGGEGGSG